MSFSSLSSCFLSLLLVAAVVWKIKQTCWASRRREVGLITMPLSASVHTRFQVALYHNIHLHGVHKFMHSASGAVWELYCAANKLLKYCCKSKYIPIFSLILNYEGWLNVTNPERLKNIPPCLTSITVTINKAIPLD